MMESTQPLTILFVDMVGSTEMYAALGDAVANKIISAEIQNLKSIVGEFCGTVIKTIGDEVMSTFPKADLAADAALKMLAQLRHTQNQNHHGHKLTFKIGFNSGLVICKEGDVFGNAVNLAARLVSLAKSKQILTTRATLDELSTTHREVSRHVDRTTLKGIADEIDICELLSLDDDMKATVNFDFVQPKSKASRRMILEYDGQEFTLDDTNKTIKLGRDAENQIICHDAGVSRLHCKIELTGDKVLLKDNSTNGTYIQPAVGEHIHCRRAECLLDCDGELQLGMPFDQPLTHRVRYRFES